MLDIRAQRVLPSSVSGEKCGTRATTEAVEADDKRWWVELYTAVLAVFGGEHSIERAGRERGGAHLMPWPMDDVKHPISVRHVTDRGGGKQGRADSNGVS